MTIDDESSVYVGGLPYDATEETVRRVFELYGNVIAVKVRSLLLLPPLAAIFFSLRRVL